MDRKFDKEFEETILACAMRDKAYAKQAIRICDAHHFGSKERSWIWSVLRYSLTQFGETPTPKMYMAIAKENFRRKQEERLSHLQAVKRIAKKRADNPKLALERLKKFVLYVNAQLALEQGAKHLEDGDLDDVYKVFGEASKKKVEERKYTLINWVEEFYDRQDARKYEREHPDEVTAIMTGWKTIDNITKGLRIGELGLIMGTTGKGKSIALNNLAYHSIKQGYETLVIPFEMPARQVATRADALWLGMNYKDLKGYNLTPQDARAIDKRYKKMAKKFNNKLKIASFPVRSATFEDVITLLEDLKEQFDGWRPKLICFDSLDHILATNMRGEKFRLQQSEVYWRAKGLGEDEGYAIYSSVHAGSQWADKTAMAEGTAESYDKARIADLIISVNDPDYGKQNRKKEVKVTEDDEEIDEEFEAPEEGPEKALDLFIAKHRDGESGKIVPALAEYHKMRIREKEVEDRR